MSNRLFFSIAVSFVAWNFTSASSAAGPNPKRIKNISYSKANHSRCNKQWPKDCGVRAETGDQFLCLSQPHNLSNMSDSCLGVLMEIGNWAPKTCVNDSMTEICPGFQGAFARLDCAAYRATKFPKSCAFWLDASGRVVNEYRERTGIDN